jgi:hypothetical protein
MVVQLKINTPIGEFLGSEMNMSNSEFEVFKIKIGSFWKEGGFEMETSDGGLVILPPHVIERSVIKIDIINR